MIRNTNEQTEIITVYTYIDDVYLRANIMSLYILKYEYLFAYFVYLL